MGTEIEIGVPTVKLKTDSGPKSELYSKAFSYAEKIDGDEHSARSSTRYFLSVMQRVLWTMY
jgi:hypothetical protein